MRHVPPRPGQVVFDGLLGATSAALLPGDVPWEQRLGYGVENTLAQTLTGRLLGASGRTVARLAGLGPSKAAWVDNVSDMVGNFTGTLAADSLGLQPFTRSIREKEQAKAEEEQRRFAEGIFQQGVQAGFSQAGTALGSSPPIQAADGLMSLLGYR